MGAGARGGGLWERMRTKFAKQERHSRPGSALDYRGVLPCVFYPKVWVVCEFDLKSPSFYSQALRGFLPAHFTSAGFYSRLEKFSKRLGQLGGSARAHWPRGGVNMRCAQLNGTRQLNTRFVGTPHRRGTPEREEVERVDARTPCTEVRIQ